MVIRVNYTYHGEHLVMFVIVEALCCTSETSIIFHINYIPIKNSFKTPAGPLTGCVSLATLFCRPVSLFFHL